MDDEKILNQGVRLALELGIRLKVEIGGVDILLESSFVGFVNEYIIITPPAPYQQIQHKMFDGVELVVRYFYQGTIYAFQTRLLSQIEKPTRLLFIEYPKLIQKSELRSEKRSFCFIPAVVSRDDKENQATIVDIARSGCHFTVSGKNNKRLMFFKIEDKVSLKCKFPGVKAPVQIVGVVKNVRSSRYDTNVGVLFHENTADVTQKIIKWYLSTIEQFISAREVMLDLP